MDRTRAGIYTRISQDQLKGTDREGAGVGRQEDACRAMCAELKLEVVDVYSDNDRSATSGEARPGWERLFTDVRSGRINHIVAWARDRLSRDTVDTGLLERLAKQHNVLITIHPGTSYDLTDPAQTLNFQIQGSVSNFESGQKNRRQKASADEDFKGGYAYLRQRVFGWKVNEEKLGRKGMNPFDCTIIKEDEAEAYRWAVEQIISGAAGPSVIAKHWNDQGFRTSRNKLWANTSVKRILRNPRYAGIQARPTDESYGWTLYPEIETKWTPIIDVPTWEELQVHLDAREVNVAKGTRASRATWLAGIVFCGVPDCHHKMYKNRTKLICNAKYGHNNTILIDVVESAVEKFVIGRLTMRAGRGSMNDPIMDQVRELQVKLAKVEEDLAATVLIENAKLRVAEQNRFTRTKLDINSEIGRLLSSNSITALISGLTSNVTAGVWSFEQAVANRAIIQKAWDGLTLNQKRRVAEHFAYYSVVKSGVGSWMDSRIVITEKDD